MIKANFNTYANYVTDSLYQWDLNQDLVISGLNLSVAPEIHFANASMDKAIVRQSALKDGVVTSRIPNSLLQSALTIKAYVGIYEGDTFKVIETVEIPVIAKERPSDYTLTNSDEEIYSFNKLENEIANAKKDFEDLSDANFEDMRSYVNENTEVLNARIDNIIAHNNDTEGNTELLDLRVGADGTVYESAGSAVRGQVNNLKSDLSELSEDTEVNMMSLINGGDMQKRIRTQFETGRKEIDGSVSENVYMCHGCFSFTKNKTGGMSVYFTDTTYKYGAVAFLDGTLVYQGSWVTESPIVIASNFTFDELYINAVRLDTAKMTDSDFRAVEKSVYYTEAVPNAMQKEIEELEEKAVTTGGVIDLSNVSLPVLSGKTLKVYYQNLCDGMLKKFLGFEAKNGEVKGYSDHCEWNETEATSFNPLVVADWTDFQARKFTNHYINLQHVRNASGSKKCLLLGDSMTDQGHYQKYANDCFEGSGLSVEWLGTRQSTYGLKHEGRSGWRAYTYTHYSETTSSDYEGISAVNPFYNPNTNTFDFSYYMTQQGYSGVDYVFICLGTNDLARSGATDENTLEAWATIINSIKSYNSNIEVVLWLCPPTCLYNGEAQAGQALNRNYRMRNIILNNYRGASWGSNNVWILPINLVVDAYNDFPITDGYATDVTHPTLSGYEKMGNVIGAMVHYLATQ